MLTRVTLVVCTLLMLVSLLSVDVNIGTIVSVHLLAWAFVVVVALAVQKVYHAVFPNEKATAL